MPQTDEYVCVRKVYSNVAKKYQHEVVWAGRTNIHGAERLLVEVKKRPEFEGDEIILYIEVKTGLDNIEKTE